MTLIQKPNYWKRYYQITGFEILNWEKTGPERGMATETHNIFSWCNLIFYDVATKLHIAHFNKMQLVNVFTVLFSAMGFLSTEPYKL